MGRKGEGEALRMGVGVGTREGKLLGGLSGRDFTYDKRLFRCAGNSALRLLVPFLLLLLFNNCKVSNTGLVLEIGSCSLLTLGYQLICWKYIKHRYHYHPP
jgi:hypothetical protein